PPCPLAWLPQQIAAPRRNQTNDSLESSGKARTARNVSKRAKFLRTVVGSADRLVDETTHLSMGRMTEAARSLRTATGGVCPAPREPAARSARSRRSQDRSRRFQAHRLDRTRRCTCIPPERCR